MLGLKKLNCPSSSRAEADNDIDIDDNNNKECTTSIDDDLNQFPTVNHETHVSTRRIRNVYGGSTPTTFKPSKKKKAVVGEEEWLEVLKEAAYEVFTDPYRGVQQELLKNENHQNSEALVDNSKSCGAPLKKMSSDNDDKSIRLMSDEEAMDEPSPWLLQCQSPESCRSRQLWKAQQIKKSTKRRKRKLSANSSFEEVNTVVRRPPDTMCRCDYNPFCLWSMGGVMDDLIHRYEKISIPSISNSRSNANDTSTDMDFSSDNEDKKQSTPVTAGSSVVDLICNGDDDVNCNDVVETEQDLKQRLPDWADSKSEYYSARTQAKLSSYRESKLVRTYHIETYLKRILQDLTSIMSIDECVSKIRERQQKLFFDNPLVITNDKSSKLRISVPPGIDNLGATCYLNTQLQCLAQNRIFVDGIIDGWKRQEDRNSGECKNSSNENSVMSNVVSLFQDLLVQLNYGHKRTISTESFSNALGIDHNEQQDPNEFSRLLLDKIHDAFNKHKTLSDHLPHIFRGNTVYETTCEACLSVSKRSEHFMDINVPICGVDKDKQKKSPRQTKISDSFKKAPKPKLDLQMCFDKYMEPERLDGDNQYYCSKCNCKQNATRAMKFGKLPPVLNIQLSRYVFDMAKLTKKKLSDKVVLTQTLLVPDRFNSVSSNEKESTDSIPPTRYLLCAVMRHKGTSAYSGHYIAEAMDWCTGEWFEFNDSKVSCLALGPSNSNAETDDGIEPEGSEDAYNMYYVEEGFLAQSIIDTLRDTGANAKSDLETTRSPLDMVSRERSRCYEDLSRLCLEDGQAADRIIQRRNFIEKKLFPDLSLLEGQLDICDTVWIDGETFRRFLSCKDRLTGLLCHSSVLQHNRLLCAHKDPGLHPRTFRKGKLITKAMYSKYCEALQIEQSSVVEFENAADTTLSTSTLLCKRCSIEYCASLSSKLKRYRTVTKLFDSLNRNNRQISYDLDDTMGKDTFVYFVSSKFATFVRNEIVTPMRKIAANLSSMNLQNCNLPAECEGLDGIFVSIGDDNEVNRPIACAHDNLSVVNANQYRSVCYSVWKSIKDLWPMAIELKEKRLFLEQHRKPGVCKSCIMETAKEEKQRSLFISLAKTFDSKPIKCLSFDEVISLSDITPEASFRIVHKEDIAKWNEIPISLKKLKKQSILSFAQSHLKTPRPKLMPPSVRDVDAASIDYNRLSFVMSTIRELACETHNRLLETTVFQNKNLQESQIASDRLSEELALLDKTEHDYLVLRLVVASVVINASENVALPEFSIDDCQLEALALIEKFRLHDTLYYRVQSELSVTATEPNNNRFCVSDDKLSKLFMVSCALCRDKSCNSSYQKWHDENSKCDTDGAKRKKCAGNESNPIELVDNEDTKLFPTKTFPLRVFEGKFDACNEELRSALLTCAGVPSVNTSFDATTRRSNRKRKTRYPVGVITDEETIHVDLDHNVAALRLLLLERYGKGPDFLLDDTLMLAVYKPSCDNGGKSNPHNVASSIVVEDGDQKQNEEELIQLRLLGCEMISRTLKDICTTMGSDIFDDQSCVMLIRIPNQDSSLTNLVDGGDLMALFFDLSNAICLSDSKRSVNRRGRKPERGFTGTVLSSSEGISHPTNNAEPIGNNVAGNETKIAIIAEELDGNETKIAIIAADEPETRHCIYSPCVNSTQYDKALSSKVTSSSIDETRHSLINEESDSESDSLSSPGPKDDNHQPKRTRTFYDGELNAMYRSGLIAKQQEPINGDMILLAIDEAVKSHKGDKREVNVVVDKANCIYTQLTSG